MTNTKVLITIAVLLSGIAGGLGFIWHTFNSERQATYDETNQRLDEFDAAIARWSR